MMLFFREKKFSYFQKASSQKRGFFFFLQAGFEKPLDPVSGMTVSLPEVDRWLAGAAEKYAQGEWAPETLLLQIRDQLQTQASSAGAHLVSVTLKEERNWELSWNRELGAETLYHRTSHYEEITNDEGADLWRLDLTWQKSLSDQFDYAYEGVKLLKTLPPGHKKRPERKLSPTSFLAHMSIESRREGWTLDL